jgi:hypothetical protein
MFRVRFFCLKKRHCFIGNMKINTIFAPDNVKIANMKKTTKISMLVTLLMCLFGTASAQYTFVVDALLQDSTYLYAYDAQWNSKDTWLHLEDPVGSLPNGTEVTIAKGDTIAHGASFKSMKKGMFKNKVEYEDRIIAITYGGQKYLALSKDLMLSPNDTSGTVDFLNKKNNRHNFWGHFYSSFTPYMAIFVLLLLATLLAAFTSSGGVIPAIMVPVFLLAAIALEMIGVYIMGTGMLWWVDADHYKMGKVIVRLILFGAAIVMQIFSMRLYKNGLSENANGELRVKRPIMGALIGAGLLLVCVIIAMIWTEDAEMILTIGGILLALSVVVAIISTAVTNIRAVGPGAGIAFTLFAVIYGVGLVVALVLLIIGLVNAFMEMIVTIGGGALVLFLMSHFVPTRTYTENGVTYEVYEH